MAVHLIWFHSVTSQGHIHTPLGEVGRVSVSMSDVSTLWVQDRRKRLTPSSLPQIEATFAH